MLLSPLFQSLQLSWRDSSPGKTYTALQTSTYSIFFGTLLLAIFAPASFQEIADAPAIQYLYLAILGVCSSAAAYVSWAKAFSKAKQTSQVSNYMFVTPFLTSVLGFLIVGEIPDHATLCGGGIILIGILIFNIFPLAIIYITVGVII